MMQATIHWYFSILDQWGLLGVVVLMALESTIAPMAPAEVRPSTAHLFIVNPLHGGLMGLFSTHPPIPERVKGLETMTVGQ